MPVFGLGYRQRQQSAGFRARGMASWKLDFRGDGVVQGLMRRREDWFESQLELDPERLVFIDETGLNTKMARLRGRSQRGE